MDKAEKVNVLGTEYSILFHFKKDDKSLHDCDGQCDYHSKTITVRDFTEEERADTGRTTNCDSYIKKVLRHEIIHAFLFESGLNVNSLATDQEWAMNEEMVDWFAIQSPKLFTAFAEALCLDWSKMI